MKKKSLIMLSIFMYFISGILLSYYAYFQLSKEIVMTPLGRVVILVLSCIFMYIGAIMLSKCLDKHRQLPLKINMIIWFLLYLLLLSTLTLFDDYFNRGLKIISWNKEMIKNYLNTSFNIKPFATIHMYVSKYLSGYFSTKIFLYNIVGNIIALMPFAFFLPLIFKKQSKFKIFLFTMIIVVLLIEGLQFITLSGSCDIDDVILNVLGALILYAILSIKSIKSFIRNIFLFENNEINYIHLIINIIILIIIFVLFGMLLNSLINI